MGRNKTTRPAKRLPIWPGPDRLTTAILNQDELTESQEEQYELLYETWAMLKDNPRLVVVKNLVKIHEISKTKAYRLISDAETFFGNIESVKIDAYRARQVQRLEGIVMNESYNIDVRLKAERLLAEIAGTLRKPEEEGKKPKKRKIIRRTTSYKKLNQGKTVTDEAIEEEYGN